MTDTSQSPFPIPERLGDLGGMRYARLLQQLKEMFPAIRGLQSAFHYCAKTHMTEDSLPLIGEQRDYPDFYFSLCPSENGILFAKIAAELLVGLYQEQSPEQAPLFSPDRFARY